MKCTGPNAMKVSTGSDTTSLRALKWLNFFLADVQTGLGPFLAAYLAAQGWNPGRVGYALTFGGLVTVAAQTPAGAIVDAVHRKRTLLALNLGVLCGGAVLLMANSSAFSVYAAQLLIGGSAPFLGPTVAAITLGMVSAKAFDRQFGVNQAFNSAGNVFAALVIAYVTFRYGYRVMFAVPLVLALPTLLTLRAIDPRTIDYRRSRGGRVDDNSERSGGLAALLKEHALIFFLVAAFLFHLSNAAMLPQLGEMLAKGNLRAAAPFMSACIIVTQLVITLSASWIGRRAQSVGRKPLLLLGFGVLPIRGVLYTLTHAAGLLIAIQTLDGVANAIFGVVSVLVIADLTRGTGHFNLAAGALATMVGIGAALSATVGGQIIQRMGFKASFLGLAAIAVCAFSVLLFAVPETLRANGEATASAEIEAAAGGAKVA
jgi:MFS family permease